MTNATTMTMTELKAYVRDHGITVEGDKRRKQSYVDAINAHVPAPAPTPEPAPVDIVTAAREKFLADRYPEVSPDDDRESTVVTTDDPWVHEESAPTPAPAAPAVTRECHSSAVVLALPAILLLYVVFWVATLIMNAAVAYVIKPAIRTHTIRVKANKRNKRFMRDVAAAFA